MAPAVALVAAVLLFAVATPVPGHAAEGVGGLPVEISDLQTGRLLLRAGRLRDARAFLEQARPESEEEQIERLFLLGRIEVRLGRPRQAARRFEAILALRPDLTRARLELARAYYAVGRDEKARHHFESTLAERLPSSVEGAVRDFLGRIDARKRWSASVSAALLPETNPAKRTGSETVLIGGAPFRLDEDARASSGVGMLASGGASFSPALGEDLRGVLAASGAAKLYRQSDWSDTSVHGEIGLARLFDEGDVSGGLRLERRWLGGDGYSRGLGSWARGRFRLSGATRLQGAASIERLAHDGMPARDGWRFTVAPGLMHAIDGRTSIRADFDLEAVTAREDRSGSRLAGLGLAVSRAFKGGLSLTPSAAFHVRRHSGPDPLFQKIRTDRQYRLGMRALHRALQFEGFAPYVGLSLEWNDSNIPIHTYRNHGITLGVSHAF